MFRVAGLYEDRLSLRPAPFMICKSDSCSDGPFHCKDYSLKSFQVLFCAAAHPGGDAPAQDVLNDESVEVLENPLGEWGG